MFWGRPVREIQLLAAVYVVAAIVLVAASIPFPADLNVGRLLFWGVITAAAVALPVRLPGGVVANLSTAPLLATAFDSALPQPFAVAWVAVLGTIEPRDLRREIPWFGSLFNKANYLLATVAAWGTISLTSAAAPTAGAQALLTIFQIALAGTVFMIVNVTLGVSAASARTGAPVRRVFTFSVRNVSVGLLSQVPLGWLMAEIAQKVGEWATLLFIVPLLLARYTFTKYTELRELFFGSVSALSQAIDAKDGFTRGHADRVSRIAGAIAREMGLSEREIEQIELGALLHDIGKIGVEDRILLKPARLEADEKALMQRHSIYGAAILEPSAALRPLVPLVRHHHESYDGSGYPDGLKGEEIPLGSRVIIVADAYEAMTSDRIYRKAPGHDHAMAQLRKYSGIQFDPKVVRTLGQVIQKRGAAAFEQSDLPPISYETLAEVRRRLAHDSADADPVHAG